MAELRSLPDDPGMGKKGGTALSLAEEVIREYQLTDLQPLLDSIARQSQREYLNVAVFGRFKAGKSSFLNHLLGRAILPVGVIPVTSVITEICYDPQESAEVISRSDQSIKKVPLAGISAYISESENPGNRRGVDAVRIFVPEMARYRGLRLVDTPGLESILAQNTEASLAWSPNTDLALVAVSVDPPLTQQDIALIERLQRFTPNVSVLLTKMDALSPAEQREVLAFVTSQLGAKFPGDVRVFPYSVKQNYEDLQKRFKEEHLGRALAHFQKEHSAVISRKLQTVLASAADYLQLAWKSAEAKEQDHERLRQDVLGSPSSLADAELQFRLVAKHAAALARPGIEHHLQKNLLFPLQKTLADRLAKEFPNWQGSFANVLGRFEQWIRSELNKEIAAISETEYFIFLEPLRDMERQCQRLLQTFRDRLSERVLHLFGVALHTTEIEIEVQPPLTPDISVGRIFDHNWELLSALIPMVLVRGLVRGHFEDKVESEVLKHLSRLTSQWEEVINSSIRMAEKQALGRFKELVQTVRRLLCAEVVGRSALVQHHLTQLRAELESVKSGEI
jgi:GTP-binding protein EngB required for normal cell division